MYVNSGDADQTPRSAASDQLAAALFASMSHKKNARLTWLNWYYNIMPVLFTKISKHI